MRDLMYKIFNEDFFIVLCVVLVLISIILDICGLYMREVEETKVRYSEGFIWVPEAKGYWKKLDEVSK